jgi:hypothetical protein
MRNESKDQNFDCRLFSLGNQNPLCFDIMKEGESGCAGHSIGTNLAIDTVGDKTPSEVPTPSRAIRTETLNIDRSRRR